MITYTLESKRRASRVNGERTTIELSARSWEPGPSTCINTICKPSTGIDATWEPCGARARSRGKQCEFAQSLVGVLWQASLESSCSARPAMPLPRRSRSHRLAPFQISGDISGTLGNPQPVDVTATGFSPGQNVFIEQCDGVDPASQTWSVSIDCDFGVSPGPAIADDSGTATFAGVGNNFQAFKNGQSEAQNKFNCIGSADRPLNNHLTTFTTCRIRVSTNNSQPTGDQAFLSITLPSVGAPAIPTNVTASAGTGSATVKWTAPSTDNGSPVTGYLITPIVGFFSLAPQEFDSTATQETITGLQSGTQYRFKVAAINARGTSQDSAASNSVKPK